MTSPREDPTTRRRSPLRRSRGAQASSPGGGDPAGHQRTRQRGWAFGVKRLIDRLCASALLVALAPLFAVAAVAIRLTSRGPVLYRSARIGRFERPITVLKFRSMRIDADERVHREHVRALLADGMVTDDEHARDRERRAPNSFKLTDDDRITKVGHILRTTSIDELPQLINVLRGDMSLVGPRPELPYMLDSYQPWQRRRFDVLPGMTGLWQVSGRDALSPAQMLELDVTYADTWTLRSDVSILLRTVPALIEKFRHGTA